MGLKFRGEYADTAAPQGWRLEIGNHATAATWPPPMDNFQLTFSFNLVQAGMEVQPIPLGYREYKTSDIACAPHIPHYIAPAAVRRQQAQWLVGRWAACSRRAAASHTRHC